MRRIALVGTTRTGANAPYDDESYEIWGVSARADYVTRATRWFELHRLDGEPKDWADNWRKTIKTFSHDLELLMFYPEPDLGPRVGYYPAERITQRFGSYFMTSSFAWIMALAIDELRPPEGEPVKGEIAIYGVEMEHGTEYSQQRAGFRHFIDLARVMGIEVTIAAASGLAYEPVPYPLWQDDPLLSALDRRKKNTRRALSELDASIKSTRTMLAQNTFAIDTLNGIDGATVKVVREKIAACIANLEAETKALTASSVAISKDIVLNEGANEEQGWLGDYLTP